jgi:hypothetical protein
MKARPCSVAAYLSHGAYFVLKNFMDASSSYSMNRTVEEIILTFADIYLTVKQIEKVRSKTGREPDPQVKDMIIDQIETIATSRLKFEEAST